MFNKKGIAGTTIEDILQEASVSRRTFYNYYKSKEHILHEMKEELQNSNFEVIIHKTLPNFAVPYFFCFVISHDLIN